MDTTDRGPMGIFEGYGDYDTPEPVPATNQVVEVGPNLAERLRERASGITTMLSEPAWKPSRSHIKAARNLLSEAFAALATQPATSQEACNIPEKEWACSLASGHEGGCQQFAYSESTATSQDGEGREAIARMIALAGLGTINGQPREPHGEWTREDFEARILTIIPKSCEQQCFALADRILAATPTPPTLSEDLREAAVKAEDAMREMFRYYDGGETRGSYDGKPERSGLRKAWHDLRAALAQVKAS